jgi:hypothetical protein
VRSFLHVQFVRSFATLWLKLFAKMEQLQSRYQSGQCSLASTALFQGLESFPSLRALITQQHHPTLVELKQDPSPHFPPLLTHPLCPSNPPSTAPPPPVPTWCQTPQYSPSQTPPPSSPAPPLCASPPPAPARPISTPCSLLASIHSPVCPRVAVPSIRPARSGNCTAGPRCRTTAGGCWRLVVGGA